MRTDIGGHGTSVAGIIGAVGNNGIGISGVAQKVSIVPLQATYDTSNLGSYIVDDIVNAIIHARNLWNTSERISIINYSGSGFGINTQILNSLVNFNGLFVWAAGNKGINLDSLPNVNNFNLDNIVSVGALDKYAERSVWKGDLYPIDSQSSSNFGDIVNVWAPGGKGNDLNSNENCLTTNSSSFNSYSYFTGTSAAAPYISGIAALMLSKDPTLTASQLKSIIISHSDVVNDFGEDNHTIKKANAYTILSNTNSHSHNFSYIWLNLYQHKSSCSCGHSINRTHVIPSEWNGEGYPTCSECGGPADLGYVISRIKPHDNYSNFLMKITNSDYQYMCFHIEKNEKNSYRKKIGGL